MHTAETIQDQVVAEAKDAGFSHPRDINSFCVGYMSRWLVDALNELEALKNAIEKTHND